MKRSRKYVSDPSCTGARPPGGIPHKLCEDDSTSVGKAHFFCVRNPQTSLKAVKALISYLEAMK